jgi:hypothetical protein
MHIEEMYDREFGIWISTVFIKPVDDLVDSFFCPPVSMIGAGIVIEPVCESHCSAQKDSVEESKSDVSLELEKRSNVVEIRTEPVCDEIPHPGQMGRRGQSCPDGSNRWKSPGASALNRVKRVPAAARLSSTGDVFRE